MPNSDQEREVLTRAVEGLDHAAAALRGVGSNQNAEFAEQESREARAALAARGDTERPHEHGWSTTGRLDTGIPGNREWGCVCGERSWTTDENGPREDTERPDHITTELDDQGRPTRMIVGVWDTERPGAIPGSYPETRKLAEMMRDTEQEHK